MSSSTRTAVVVEHVTRREVARYDDLKGQSSLGEALRRYAAEIGVEPSITSAGWGKTIRGADGTLYRATLR
jgi:hypothetical protein